MLSSTYDAKRTRLSLFEALINARSGFGAERVTMVDGDDRALTYRESVRAALALGHALKRGTAVSECVGVLLPTGLGSILTVLGLSAYGRVPAVLNFTAGQQSLAHALAIAKVKRIVTARRFIDLAKLEPLEAALAPLARFVYLEDVRARLSLGDKLAAAIGSLWPRLIVPAVSPDSPALVLYTSGTEGQPKGVVLSHANLLANVEQVRVHLPLREDDVVFNCLPTFHSFGLTVGSLMPIILGLKTVLHPTPRQPKEIVRRIRRHRATILLATDTFISQYARAAEEGDLASLRLAVCGAERLRDETRQLVRRKCAAELLEGYGVTEAAPVIAANRPGANRQGTVGHLVAMVDAKVEPIDGISGAGRLFVRGPNIMLGYLSGEKPGEIAPPKDGWHDTGDVVSFDEDGYLAIRGRLKRFAKVGGEAVSLTVVENCASALWPDDGHAAIAIADGRRGEAIILVTTNGKANRGELLVWARNHGVSELAMPRQILRVEDVPVLGTGKTDYVAVAKLVAERLEQDALRGSG